MNEPATTERDGRIFTLTVYAAGPDEGDDANRLLGHITIRPGLVAPGHVAAVHTPDGLLRLGRIYYDRAEGAREYIRLESLEPGGVPLFYALEDVSIEGVVICVCGVDEECGCRGEFPAGE